MLHVLYPGRPSSGAGPDFQDALLITEEGDFVRGDVEVHIRQRDWRAHGHHLDSRYNHVVLHLFLQGERDKTCLESGAQVPEVLLISPLHSSASSNSRLSGAIPLSAPPSSLPNGRQIVADPMESLRLLSLKELEQALDDAGERRFLHKASAMLEHLRGGDAQEILYAGLMEGLGYSRNRNTMLLLARGLPFRQLRRLTGQRVEPLVLEAVLLGTADLLPHQSGHSLPIGEARERSGELADIWHSMGEPLAVTAGMWNRSGLRPQNSPERRLVGASYLIEEYRSAGLVDGLRNVLEKGSQTEIEKGLEVGSSGFWANHLDFHHPVAQAPALIGRSRAREIVINVLMPFFYARAHLLGDGNLKRRISDIYCSFPPGQDNEITREVKALLMVSNVCRPVVNSARRQQGLIHMYRVLQGQAK